MYIELTIQSISNCSLISSNQATINVLDWEREKRMHNTLSQSVVNAFFSTDLQV